MHAKKKTFYVKIKICIPIAHKFFFQNYRKQILSILLGTTIFCLYVLNEILKYGEY